MDLKNNMEDDNDFLRKILSNDPIEDDTLEPDEEEIEIENMPFLKYIRTSIKYIMSRPSDIRMDLISEFFFGDFNFLLAEEMKFLKRIDAGFKKK